MRQRTPRGEGQHGGESVSASASASDGNDGGSKGPRGDVGASGVPPPASSSLIKFLRVEIATLQVVSFPLHLGGCVVADP